MSRVHCAHIIAKCTGTPYPDSPYGTPRDTLNDLVRANAVEENLTTLVRVSCSKDYVPYASLAKILNRDIFGKKEMRPVLRIQEGTAIPPDTQAFPVETTADGVRRDAKEIRGN